MKDYQKPNVILYMKIGLSVLIALMLILGAWLLFARDADSPAPTDNPNVATTTPVVSTSTSPVATSTKSNIISTADIRITSPRSGDTIKSPFTLTGEARGNWYFEASAPVYLEDANGKKIAQGYVEAQGDWMTTNFVPFKGTLTWATTTSTSTAARVIFMNDNPSGEPAFQKSVSVPVILSR